MRIDEMMTVEMAAKIELDFLHWEARSRDTLDVKRCYVDVAGDLIAGVLLSQIVYWFLPSRHGESKLMVEKYGRRWLVKGRVDWWEECRITPRQFDRAIEMLEELGLVETRVSRFQGKPMKHISVRFEALVQALDGLPFLHKGEKRKLPKGEIPFLLKGEKLKLHFGEIHVTETTAETTSTNTPLPPSKSEGGCVEDTNAHSEATARSDPGSPGSPSDLCPQSDFVWTAEELRGDLAQAVGLVMRGCGFVDPRLAPVLRGVLGRSPPEGLRAQADAMIAAWAEYGGWAELLRFTWGPRKFFGHGHWERADSWPVDRERWAQERNSRVGVPP
jgi:hypothetical protein